MARPTFAPALGVLFALVFLVAGCGRAAPPVAQKPPAGRPTVAQEPVGHDHSEHGHADHAAHDDHHGHDHGPPTAGAALPAEAGGADEGDHGHHHPETLAELVGELVSLAAVVKEGMEANIREKADSPIHQFGHLAGDLEGLAKEAKLPADVEAAVVKAGEDLFNAFDKLDEAVHGAGDIADAWREHADGIAAGLKTLQDAVAK